MPVSSPDKDKVDPIYEDVEVTAQQSEDFTATDVKMEDNPAYDTIVCFNCFVHCVLLYNNVAVLLHKIILFVVKCSQLYIVI